MAAYKTLRKPMQHCPELIACIRKDFRIERLEISGLAEGQRIQIARIAARAFEVYGEGERLDILCSLSEWISPLIAIGITTGKRSYNEGSVYLVYDNSSGEMAGFAINTVTQDLISFGFGAIDPSYQHSGIYKDLVKVRLLGSLNRGGRNVISGRTKNPVVPHTVNKCLEELRRDGVVIAFDLHGTESLSPSDLERLEKRDGLLSGMVSLGWSVVTKAR